MVYIHLFQDIKARQNVEFSVDADKPVIVPKRSDKFRQKKYYSEPIEGIPLKSLCTSVNVHDVSGFESDDAPPSYSHAEEYETAETEFL